MITTDRETLTTNKAALINLLHRTQPAQYNIAIISSDYKDAAKSTLLKAVASEAIERSKRFDVAVLIIELPKKR
jgi:hypothetical protein